MNRFVGPFFYEIAKGIGSAFGLDAGDWIVIVIIGILILIGILLIYIIVVFSYTYIGSWLNKYYKSNETSGGSGEYYERLLNESFHGEKDSFRELESMAGSGDKNAQYYLWILLKNEKSPYYNIELAIYWLKKSAENGNINAQKIYNELEKA